MQSSSRFTCSILSLLALSAFAQAETTECIEIASVPAQITAPGSYCLKASMSFTPSAGPAINILSHDVVLDLNGHVLDGSSAGAGTVADGIHAMNRQNITLRNGVIRGFFRGVFLEDVGRNSMGHRVEGLFLDRNTGYGLHVSGHGSVIRGNRIVGTGGTTFAPDAVGIVAGGPGVRVIDNEVIGTLERAGGEAYGIFVHEMIGGVVERNVVSNAAFGPAASTGIFVSLGRVTVAGNHVLNMRIGIAAPPAPSALYVDNTVGGATTAFSGGAKAGTTNHSF